MPSLRDFARFSAALPDIWRALPHSFERCKTCHQVHRGPQSLTFPFGTQITCFAEDCQLSFKFVQSNLNMKEEELEQHIDASAILARQPGHQMINNYFGNLHIFASAEKVCTVIHTSQLITLFLILVHMQLVVV